MSEVDAAVRETVRRMRDPEYAASAHREEEHQRWLRRGGALYAEMLRNIRTLSHPVSIPEEF